MVRKNFQKLNSFFGLSGRSGNAPFMSGGEKTFQPANSFFLTHSDILLCPTAFGWGLGWPNAPWLCEWWCNTWDGHGMVMGVSTGNIPKGVAGDLKHSQVWLHQHSQSHGTPVQSSLALSQMLWPKKYAIFFHRFSQAEKVFSPRDRIEALQLRPTNQKKLFSLWKVFFWKSTTVMC